MFQDINGDDGFVVTDTSAFVREVVLLEPKRPKTVEEQWAARMGAKAEREARDQRVMQSPLLPNADRDRVKFDLISRTEGSLDLFGGMLAEMMSEIVYRKFLAYRPSTKLDLCSNALGSFGTDIEQAVITSFDYEHLPGQTQGYDLNIAGVPVGIKNTTGKTWMARDNVVGTIQFLTQLDIFSEVFSAGLIFIECREYLTEGNLRTSSKLKNKPPGNGDKKFTIATAYMSQIDWLVRERPFHFREPKVEKIDFLARYKSSLAGW